MDDMDYFYKGYDIENTKKREKLQYEYFNPYGCNIYSNSRRVKDIEYDVTHTNQDDKIK